MLLRPRHSHLAGKRPEQASLEARIREICQTRVRYGYRRVHVLFRREGWRLGQNKTRRIYRELANHDSANLEDGSFWDFAHRYLQSLVTFAAPTAAIKIPSDIDSVSSASAVRQISWNATDELLPCAATVVTG